MSRCGDAFLERCEPEELAPEGAGGRAGGKGGRRLAGHQKEDADDDDEEEEEEVRNGEALSSLHTLLGRSSPWWARGAESSRRRVAGLGDEDSPSVQPSLNPRPESGQLEARSRSVASSSVPPWKEALRCFTGTGEDQDATAFFQDDVDERIFVREEEMLSFRELVPEYTPEGALYYLMKDYREQVGLRREALAVVRRLRVEGRKASRTCSEAIRVRQQLEGENAQLRRALEAQTRRGDEAEKLNAGLALRLGELEGANDEVSRLLAMETSSHQRLQERHHAMDVNLRQTRARSERLKQVTVQRAVRAQKELKQTEQRYMLLSMDHQANSIAALVKYEELDVKLRTAKTNAKEIDKMYGKVSKDKVEALAEIERLKKEAEVTKSEKLKLWEHINTLNSAWDQEMRIKEAHDRED